MNAQRTRRPVGAALPGFEHIERVWDAHHNIWLAKLHPGDACVTASTEGLTTVLGSCIAACLRDVRTGVGGMNHFMLLPGPAAGSEDQHATAAMAALVTAVLTHGCGERSRLELKLVGGCRLTQDAPDTAQRALEFARAFAAAAQLTIVAEDIGGVLGREVVYWPGTGQLRIRKLRGLQALVAGRERDYGESLRALRAGADTEGGRVG